MRVLVLRPEDGARRTVARLEARGHEAVAAALLEVRPLDSEPPDGEVDAILVTSANAAAAAAAAWRRLGPVPVFAVGERARETLEGAGLPVEPEAARDAVALAALVEARMPPASRLLHVAGRHRRPEPERSLVADGHQVRIWEAYEATAAEALPSAVASAIRAGELDAALHYSRRAAEVFSRLALAAGCGREAAGLRHLCLSAEVADGLSDLDPAKVTVAAQPDERHLLDALDAMSRAGGSQGMRPACTGIRADDQPA